MGLANRRIWLVFMLVIMLVLTGFVPIVGPSFGVENEKNDNLEFECDIKTMSIGKPLDQPLDLTTHAPIRIDDDTGFNTSNGVIHGNGSFSNPYVIENWSIDGSGAGNGIFIGNTTSYFIIRNCTIHNASGNSGSYYLNANIYFNNVKNGILDNCTVENASRYGVALNMGTLEYNRISNNTVKYNGFSGIFILSDTVNTIENNTIFGVQNSFHAIELRSSSNQKIINNKIFESGIGLIGNANKHTIINNKVNGKPVVYFKDTTSIILPPLIGQLILGNCKSITISNISISNTSSAIILDSCDLIKIENCLLLNNTDTAIFMTRCTNCIIKNNDIIGNNDVGDGIYGTNMKIGNLFINNHIRDHYFGIWFQSLDIKNKFKSNKIKSCAFGLSIRGLDPVTVVNNTIADCTHQSIYISSGNGKNVIHHNNFINNNGGGVQAYDSLGNNYWNDSTGEGNYWSDYQTRYPNAKHNSPTWDTPYQLDGGAGAQDNAPMVYQYHPPIRINGDSNFTLANGVSSGNGTANNPYIIEDWDINGSGFGHCIYVGNTSKYFVIRDCYLHDSNGNNVNYYWDTNLLLFNESYGIIENSTSIDSSNFGLLLMGSNNNTIRNFTSIKCSQVLLWYNAFPVPTPENSDNNTFENCRFISHFGSGLIISNCKNNLVNNSLIMNNTNGVQLQMAANNNDFTNNSITENRVDGFNIDTCHNNSITNNDIFKNTNYGVALSDSNDNWVHHNNFIDNNAGGVQGNDNTGTNNWDDGVGEGNFWSDYLKRYPSATSDGHVWSPPYNISGAGDDIDSYPLYRGIGLKYSPRAIPIRIDNDANFTNASGVVWGDGTAGDPYIIDGWEINGTGYGTCIYIGNTTKYYEIRNCYLHNASGNTGLYYGNNNIRIFNSDYGTIENCIIENAGGNGIYISGGAIVRDMIIANNTIHDVYFSGIYTIGGRDCTYFNNTIWGIRDTYNGINLVNSNNQHVINNSFTNTGIRLGGQFNKHTITGNEVNGKPIYYYNETNNFVVPSDVGQLLLGNCYNTTISGLNISNTSIGILLGSCSNVTIQNCNLTNNRHTGINMELSQDCIIENNTIKGRDLGAYGISGGSNLPDNKIQYNNIRDVYFGIYFSSNSESMNISNNNIESCLRGIYFISAHSKTIDYNLIVSCELGMYFSNSDMNIIINNTIKECPNGGIRLNSQSVSNTIHHNNFINNNFGGVQGFDDNGTNFWNDTLGEGNYWDDYISRYPGATNNGVYWDIPYNISGLGDNIDHYPLVKVVGVGLTTYKPIRIDNNTGFNGTNGVSAGAGTQNNPYIIEGWKINGTGYGYCIYVGNTTKHFIIKNSSLHSASGVKTYPYYPDSAVVFHNATNGTVYNNNVTRCNFIGIHVNDSMDCMVLENKVSNNQYSGVGIGNSSDIIINDNNVSNNPGHGIITYYVDNFTADNNDAHWNDGGGFYIIASNESSLTNNRVSNNNQGTGFAGIYFSSSGNNSLEWNHVNNNPEFGVWLDWSNDNTGEYNEIVFNCGGEAGLQLTDSHRNTFALNNISNSTGEGVVLYTSNHNVFDTNTINGNNMASGMGGVYSWRSHNNTWLNNTYFDNKIRGLWLSECNKNKFFDNKIIDNNNTGIEFYKGNGNVIAKSIISGNGGYGIRIYGNSLDHAIENTIFNNTIINNGNFGIFLANYDNSTIYNNDIINNSNDGIRLSGLNGCRNVTLENNSISNNDGEGIKISSFGGSLLNKIIYNNIINNTGFGIGFYNVVAQNTIHHNNFIDNNGSWADNSKIQCHDENGNNYWNDTNQRGNYWNHYKVKYPLATSNGYYWNIPYDLNATELTKDYYPLAHLVDFAPPAITDNTLGPAYTGDPFTIQANITDISNVSQVQVFYYFGSDIGNAKNRTMVYNSGNDLWEHAVEGDIPSGSIDPLKYNISAVDPNDRWGESKELSIPVVDNDAPTAAAGSDLNIVMGQKVIFDGSGSSDNIGVVNYTWNFTYNGNPVISYLSSFEHTFDIAGVYQVNLTVRDAALLTHMDSLLVTVSDVKRPMISNLNYPSTVNISTPITITVRVSDPSGLSAVKLVYMDVNSAAHNVTMTKQSGDNYMYMIPGQAVNGQVQFHIWVNDSFGNLNYTTQYIINIIDNILPKILGVSYSSQVDKGEVINISVEVEDNIGISEVKLNFTGVNSTNYNVTMTESRGTNYTYMLPAQDETGLVSFYVWVQDSNGNWNKTNIQQINIIEEVIKTRPTFTWVLLPVEVDENKPFTVKVRVQDLNDVSAVYLNYTDVNGTTYNASMTAEANNTYSYDISAQNMPGTISLFVSAVNNNDHWNRTGNRTVTIVAPPPPDNDPPFVKGTDPKDNAKNVSIKTKVRITFNESIKTSTIIGQIVIKPALGFNLTWQTGDTVLVLEFAKDLNYAQTYEITLGTNITDMADNPLAQYTFSFTTESEPVTKEDTDNDNLPDTWEEEHGLNPNDPNDAANDSDDDGLTNLEEYNEGIASTDPTDRDTDGDQIDDKWERDNNLNPLNPADASEDADNDTYTNLEEYNGNSDPNNSNSVPEEEEEEEKEKEKEPDYTLMLLAIIIVIIIIIALLALLMRKKKPAEKGFEEEEEELPEELVEKEPEDLDEELDELEPSDLEEMEAEALEAEADVEFEANEQELAEEELELEEDKLDEIEEEEEKPKKGEPSKKRIKKK